MSAPIVQTVNKKGAQPQVPTLSDLSIIPIPPTNPAVHLLRTAGQVGTPPPSSSHSGIPTTFYEQTRYAFDNIAACLGAGGATPRDVTKITIFVVNLNASMRGTLVDIITKFFTDKDGYQHRPPSSLIGVAALASPEFLIEVEAEAAISV